MSAVQAETIQAANSDIPALFKGLQANAIKLRQSSIASRIEKLRKLSAAVVAAREEIRVAVREELHLHDVDIDGQLIMIKAEAEFLCNNLEKWVARQPVKGSIMTLGKKSYIQYEPKGVVLTIAAWNAPYAIGLVPSMGALAAGNSVCLKPSELAPKSSALLKRIVESVYSADEFAVVEGGADVAQALLAQPFNHIFYIGSHRVGRIIMKAAADYFASVTLEMGGKNPVIIDASADLNEAAHKIGWGRLANCGQICVAPDYALVEESVADEFIQRLQDAITEMYDSEGVGFKDSSYFARIVNSRHADRIKGLIDDAVKRGARVRFGGEVDVEDCYVAPTIIDQVSEEMDIMSEEIFGPVITVVPYSKREDVPGIIARRPKPLSLYVFSKDRSNIDYFLNHTTSGNSVVNHNIVQSGTNPHLPFGGVNESGSGRIGGWSTFLEASNARSVVEEGPPITAPDLMFPPYDDKYKKMVDDMLNKTVKVPDAVIKAINGVIKVRSIFSRK